MMDNGGYREFDLGEGHGTWEFIQSTCRSDWKYTSSMGAFLG